MAAGMGLGMAAGANLEARPQARVLVLFWQLLGLLVRAEAGPARSAQLTLVQDLIGSMGLSATTKAQSIALLKQVLGPRGAKLSIPAVATNIRQAVAAAPVTLDFVFELLVAVALAAGPLSPARLKLLLTYAPALGVDKVRLQHLVRLRQHELNLARSFQGKPLAYQAFTLPQPQQGHHEPPLAHEATPLLTAAERHAQRRVHPALVRYACDLLALERNFSLEQAAAATQLLVLHYAPVQLERAHMPRPLIRLAQKKVADAISAFNLLRRI